MRSVPAFLLFIGYVFCTGSCQLYTIDRETLAHIELTKKGFSVDVDYVATGATSEDVIQIRKVYSNGKSEVVKNVSSYNKLLNYHLDGDSLLSVVLSDTENISVRGDTLRVKL
jgi:hypothetical protein